MIFLCIFWDNSGVPQIRYRFSDFESDFQTLRVDFGVRIFDFQMLTFDDVVLVGGRYGRAGPVGRTLSLGPDPSYISRRFGSVACVCILSHQHYYYAMPATFFN